MNDPSQLAPLDVQAGDACTPSECTAMASPYILLVEDNPGDAILTRALLEDGATAPAEVRWAQSLESAVHLLETVRGCEAVLLDLGLPDIQGLATLQAIRPYATDCPVVVLTGDDDELVGLKAVVEGAQDFLVKGSFDGGLLRRSLGFAAHRKRAERALLERALHDELTGLPRRALLMDRLQEAIKRTRRGCSEGALLFIDLDHFKQINDTFGHATGDRVLCVVAERLRGALRETDTAARVGGDEFVVLLPSLQAAEDGLMVGGKLLAALMQPLQLGQHEISVSASVGVASFHDSHCDPQELVSLADAAMYAAKKSGRGGVMML
jgi:diguanylate cyclase (GGDEF)-like protein